jgi:hypothetical protein
MPIIQFVAAGQRKQAFRCLEHRHRPSRRPWCQFQQRQSEQRGIRGRLFVLRQGGDAARALEAFRCLEHRHRPSRRPWCQFQQRQSEQRGIRGCLFVLRQGGDAARAFRDVETQGSERPALDENNVGILLRKIEISVVVSS